ncbi:MAG TPA: DUF2330 domain-containing protein [Pseudolysinimonas sp.]|nr:DUF2330 domain-containing protein [Pseudolysinimonas sp.]
MRQASRARFLSIVPVAAILLGFQIAAPAAACACGAPAPRPGQDVIVDKEHAILSWDGGRERIELLLDMLTDADDVGLIFPTPAPATVTAGDRETFVQIEEAIQPKQVIVDDWWAGDYGDGSAGGAPPNVIDQVQLGPVQATTLEASDTEGLTDWLDANGYAIRDEIAAGLQDYIERGWFFVALKLTSDVPLEGGLDPIAFTFDSDQLVYPMELSRHATTLQRARLYVFQDHRARVAGLEDPTPMLPGEETVWAGPAPDGLETLGDYLTVVDLTFESPASQIPGDLLVVQAGDDEPLQPAYTVTRPVTVFGVPFGVAVILGAAAAILVLFALGSLIARALRPQRRS